MKQTALEDYTRQDKLYGQNEQQVLDKFIQYSQLCRDPHNIFKYMEEKSICIYLANYWIARAQVFAEMGHFPDALVCLKEATQRNHIVSEDEVQIEEHLLKIRRKIVQAMKRFPPRNKRTANQYSLVYEKQDGVTFQAVQSLVAIFEKNYILAKAEVEKQFELKMHGKKNSWLFPIEEEENQKMKQIEEKIRSSNNHEAFFSMRTPITKKDTMRLTKTIDSIEMLKKKKSTQPKTSKKNKLGENNSAANHTNQNKMQGASQSSEGIKSEDCSQDQNLPDCMHTTPVGRDLMILRRKVTFNSKNEKQKYGDIEKIRASDHEPGRSTHKEPENNPRITEQSRSCSKRGSILKNRQGSASHISMEEQK